MSDERLPIYVEGGQFPIAQPLRTAERITFTADDLRAFAEYGERPFVPFTELTQEQQDEIAAFAADAMFGKWAH